MKKYKSFQPRIPFRQRITLLLFGIFLFFVLLEISLRLGGFALLSIQEYRNRQTIRQKGAYRILCLGESTTQGEYPQFLEQLLNQRNIGVRFSVVDKGRSNTKTSIILNQLEPYLNQYHPDMVVTMMGINDGEEHIPYEAVTTSKGMLLIRSFRIYKLTKLLWLHILTKAKETGLYRPNADKQLQTYFPKIWLKEALAESILTEESPKKAIDLNSKNDNTCFNLGWLYREKGEISQAEDAFQKAVDLNPKNDHAYVELGRIYRWQGKFAQAEDAFKKAIELDPENPDAYMELGRIYWKQFKLHQAEEPFKKVEELTPKNPDAYMELGWIYQEQGKSTQAEGLFQKAIDINPKNDRIYGAMSVLYEELGRSELSEEYARKANRLRLEYYTPVTVNNYRKLKEILDKQGIRLVCVQYPMRSIEPLKKIFEQDEGVVFVDNENVFKEALKKTSYKEYFRDMFAGDFGHCKEKGNRLLAQNIANVILREVFYQ